MNELDFGAVTAPGTYEIEAAAGRSPRFEVGGPDLYSPLLDNALFYFLAQRDGTDVNPSTLERRPAHLNDAHAPVYDPPLYVNGRLVGLDGPVGTADVEGGWFDAGDYIKLTGTASFVVAVMEVALRDHPALFADGGPDFRAEARRGLRWLLKMWDDRRRVLYYQVGIGNGGLGYLSDHDVWRLPEVDDHLRGRAYRFIAHRPVFRVGPPGTPVPPSLAGRLAAAFGLCSQVFQQTSPSFADRCLRSGEDVYGLAKTKHTTNHWTSPSGFYPENGQWRDDMELGAVELELALAGSVAGSTPTGLAHGDSGFYLHEAARWANAYTHAPPVDRDVFNLYDVSGLAHPELMAAIAASADTGGLPVTPSDLLADMRAQLDKAARRSARDPFGFGWYHWDPSPHAFGLAIEGTWYDEASGTDRYADLARSNLDWGLGANAWGTTFVIGAGTTFPFCPQNQMSNLVGSLNGSPPVLLGGTVDGPSDYIPTGFFGEAPKCPPDGRNPFRPFDRSGWRYVDRVASWATVEPADDYTSLSFLAFALVADGALT